MIKCYIHSAVSISAQDTFESEDVTLKMLSILEKKVEAKHPSYKNYISPTASRRMATGVKMGVAAAKKALEKDNLQQTDAILTGTGMGCIEDTEKFLNALIANDEAYLTPTSFIQSTHNTVGAQIALGLECKSYNNTYVHGAISFESALMDAQLMLQQNEAQNILVGAVDELGTEFINALRMMEDKSNKGIKVPFGEAASFFVVSSVLKKDAIELDLQIYSSISKDSLAEKLNNFLKQNSIQRSEIDALFLGRNGDAFDDYYDKLVTFFHHSIEQINFKNYSGEFYTASAFGLFIGCHFMKKEKFKTVLLYNQFKGRDHSFILLKTC